MPPPGAAVQDDEQREHRCGADSANEEEWPAGNPERGREEGGSGCRGEHAEARRGQSLHQTILARFGRRGGG
jgi:hypothetical protein